MTTTRSTLEIRLKGELPPTPPLPSTLQTLACRWAPLDLFEWARRSLGDRFTLYPLDIPPVVLLSHPADIRAVLDAPSDILHPGAGGNAISPIVGGDSFMLKEADEHVRGRRAIAPAFSAKAIARHADMVEEIVAAEVGSWPLDGAFPAHPRLRRMSLRIILSTIFAAEWAKLTRLHEHLLAMLDVTASFTLVEPRLRRLPGWRGIWRRFLEARARVDEDIRELIAGRERDTDADDVLARLLSASNADGSAMTATQARDNLVSVILAGHETTASAIAWALTLLAHTPHVQSRLAREIDAGQDDSYMLATVAEVLRHRPVFLFAIPRVVAKPMEIGGWSYRPPAQLLPCIYLLHHDARLYPDPHAFRPERFLADPPAPGAWLPWGGGAKRCPGHRLATLEMQTVLRATLATRTIAPGTRELERARWRSVIVTPARGAQVVLSARPTAAHAGGRVSGYRLSYPATDFRSPSADPLSG